MRTAHLKAPAGELPANSHQKKSHPAKKEDPGFYHVVDTEPHRLVRLKNMVVPDTVADASVIVGVVKFAKMFDRSRWWARAKLEKWLAEQNRGGPKRVWEDGSRLYTTLAVVQRDMPGARDPVIMRKLKEHDKDLDVLARRVNDLTTQLASLRKQLEPKSGVRIRA